MSRIASVRPSGRGVLREDGWAHGVPPPDRVRDPRLQPESPAESPVPRVRVALIEDNLFARDQLSGLLNRQPDLEVVASGAASTLGLAHIQAAAPQVIVLDAASGGDAIRDCLLRGKELMPEARFLVLNVAARVQDVIACIERGASGFVLAEATVEELLGTIRMAARGRCVLPDPLTPKIFSHLAEQSFPESTPAGADWASCLTACEGRVEALIAEGLTNRAIAGRLGVSVHTIKCHVRNILKKHGLVSRLQVAVHFRAPADTGTSPRGCPVVRRGATSASPPAAIP